MRWDSSYILWRTIHHFVSNLSTGWVKQKFHAYRCYELLHKQVERWTVVSSQKQMQARSSRNWLLIKSKNSCSLWDIFENEKWFELYYGHLSESVIGTLKKVPRIPKRFTCLREFSKPYYSAKNVMQRFLFATTLLHMMEKSICCRSPSSLSQSMKTDVYSRISAQTVDYQPLAQSASPLAGVSASPRNVACQA